MVEGGSGSQSYYFSHCRSSLHGGVMEACYWKESTGTEAKKEAAKDLIQLALVAANEDESSKIMVIF